MHTHRGFLLPIFKHCAKFAQCFFHAVLAHSGRAPVSKTGSRRFDPCRRCHAAGGAYPAQDRILTGNGI